MSLPTVNDASAPLSKQSAGVGGKGGDVGGARGGGGGKYLFIYNIMVSTQRPLVGGGAQKRG